MPRTLLVEASEEALSDIYRVFEGAAMLGASERFFQDLSVAGEDVGYPFFLRTGHTAGKHNWRHTCYVGQERELKDHAVALIEYSDIISFSRFSVRWWAVRELLPIKPLAVAPLFADMPVCREFRLFVSDGVVQCIHPYWSEQTLYQGGIEKPQALCAELSVLDDTRYLTELASCAGRALGGAWSVDIMHSERGWSIVDMAEASKSYHRSGCKNSFD